MKRYLCLLALLCLFAKLPAQEKLQPMSIGEKLPNITIGNILNHPQGETTLAAYRGKWLILDFWATWCSPCISAFPKLDSLQRIFKEQVQFLPVTYQSKAEVEKLMARLKEVMGVSVSLPLVMSDTILHGLFPHRYLPYYIWIDPDGKVVATTGPEEVTAANIEAMVANKNVILENSKYVEVPFSKDELLVAGNRKMKKKPVQFQSALLPYIEGLSSGYTIFPADPEQGKRILATNARLLLLFQLAYSNGKTFFARNRTILEVKDTSVFISGKIGSTHMAWLRSGHGWCYELVVPQAQSEDIWKFMQEDLQRFFPQYQVTVQKRKVPCLALVFTKNDKPQKLKPLESSGGDYHAEFSFFGGELRNGVLVDLIARLNVRFLSHLSTPVIDETGYSGRVDLKLEANMGDVNSIRQALQAYGLDLVEVNRKIKVLVIEDSSHGT